MSRRALSAAAAALALAVPTAATAAPATPGPQGRDARFGTCGTFVPLAGAQAAGEPPRLANGPAGSVVAAGAAQVGPGNSIYANKFVISRFSTDGLLDPAFSGDGVATVDIPRPKGALEAELSGLAVQPDGKVLVAGWVQLEGTVNHRSLLARLNADGTPDASFGSNGVVSAAFPGGQINDIALTSGGGFVAVGTVNKDAGQGSPRGNDRFTVAAYRQDGTPDTAFGGGGGVVTVDPGFGGSRASVVRVLPGGRILAGGQAGEQFELVRLLPDGTPDPSFGTGGATYDSPPASASITSLAVLPDGGAYALGTAVNVNGDQVAIARYGADGRLDASFGRAGSVIDSRVTQPGTITLDTQGRLLATGFLRYTGPFGGGGHGLVRYGDDGKRDESFGLEGGLGGSASYGYTAGDVLAQADGTALAGVKDGLDLAVARFAVDEPALGATAAEPRACSSRVTTKSLSRLLRPGKKAPYGKLSVALDLRQPGGVRVTAVASVGGRSATIGSVVASSLTFGKAVATIKVSKNAARLLRPARQATVMLTAQGTDRGAASTSKRTLKR